MSKSKSKRDEFIATMARMTTPYDDMKERKKAYAKDYNIPLSEVTEEEVISDYSGDDAWEEAQAFWRMILEARKL